MKGVSPPKYEDKWWHWNERINKWGGTLWNKENLRRRTAVRQKGVSPPKYEDEWWHWNECINKWGGAPWNKDYSRG